MNNYILIIVKVTSMLIMFLMVYLVGIIPIKSVMFKQNKQLQSYCSAFSGGLFLSVGIIHLLPEANDSFTQYFNDSNPHFPYAHLITVLSFALILWIEKVAFRQETPHVEDVELETLQVPLVETTTNTKLRTLMPNQLQLAQDIQNNLMAPYILQLAIGIHAIFEGLAIGIENKVPDCIGIATAVICHKWAEGLTLGVAFKKANIEQNQAIKMILFQGILNPFGIGLGWILQSQGHLVTGIFQSISAGTFVYIATIQVIVEEFNVDDHKISKFCLLMFAIGFISSIWFIEQI